MQTLGNWVVCEDTEGKIPCHPNSLVISRFISLQFILCILNVYGNVLEVQKIERKIK